MSKRVTLSFKLNGGLATVTAPPAVSLQRILREALNLTGTKNGCGEGECGACTVLFDGVAVNSCLVPFCQVEGRTIVTIEAFDHSGDAPVHPLLHALVTHGAVQCGFCTPGVVMSAVGLLNHNPNPTRDAIREALAGNLCRCTGYDAIFRALQSLHSVSVMPVPRYREYRGEIRETDRVDVIPVKHLEELKALEVLDSWDLRFLAGGTDLMVSKNGQGKGSAGDMWIDLARCAELQHIRIVDGRMRIGSGVTWAELTTDPHVRQYAPALAQAATQVGSAQIRAKGTLGGNLANASPAGDSFPVLAALKTHVVTVNPGGGTRTIPVEELVIRPGKTCLNSGECIVEVIFPVDARRVSGFFKSVPRCAQALAKVSVAIGLTMDGNVVEEARVALGAAGPRVVLVERAGHCLVGRALSPDAVSECVSASIDAAAPIDDFRATRDYRIRMIEVGIRRVMASLSRQNQRSSPESSPRPE
ncbi:FAD binding domain-containing protein [bacterium]|nr:FAD binding domain-containing protein [candidate division CSSED10-310 bacterium]